MLNIADKRWSIQPFDAEKAFALSDSLNIRKIYGQLLVGRGIHTFEDARRFFRPQLSDLHDPYTMKDMDVAVQCIDQAICHQKKILIYGDYDVDGTTAVAVLYSFLRERYDQIDFYVPHRYREGYGISIAGIEYARENDFSLIIALDCGIKAIDKIRYARSFGLDIIVCDHHLPGKTLPPANAILNPKQPGCHYPYKELSGCGIGFKLITALAKSWKLTDESILRYIDLVATSIAADIVPITGENRILTYYGLQKINTAPLPGLKALIQLSSIQKENYKFRVEDLVFIIAPRVNAAGRMDDAQKAVKLFIEKDYHQAMDYAELLHKANADRKGLDKNITEEALDIINENKTLASRNTTVLFRPHWHKGVIGIVASRLMETYYRPTIILTQSQDKVAGSARSVTGFNIYEALHQCHDLLEDYGGHFYAAGMTLKPENVPVFADKFEDIVSSTIDPNLLIREIKIDAEIRLKDITPEFYRVLEQFEPFGPGSMRPVFMVSGVQDNGYSKIIKQHIRFEIKQENSKAFSGIGFNLAHKFDLVSSGRPFDICFRIDENEWNGKTNIQLKVIDIRPGII
jgi:single-stranded-DNA-specific exonuclease